jgi:hypothetical protein
MPADVTGEQLKQDGMSLAAQAAADWLDDAWLALVELVRTGRDFTSEEVVERVGLPRGTPGTNRNNAVGALFAAAAREGIITRVGFRKAVRPDLHARLLTVWRGVAR